MSETADIVGISDIITRCGGVTAVADATGKTPSAVHKWKANGIPDTYWPTLIALSGGVVTVETLFGANVSVRERAA